MTKSSIKQVDFFIYW